MNPAVFDNLTWIKRIILLNGLDKLSDIDPLIDCAILL
jgi:hypothetical protein